MDVPFEGIRFLFLCSQQQKKPASLSLQVWVFPFEKGNDII